MNSYLRISIGVDFGTESCRIVFLDIDTGKTVVSVTSTYRHGVIDSSLPSLLIEDKEDISSIPNHLPNETALQNPLDWFTSLQEAMNKAHDALTVYLNSSSSSSASSSTSVEFIGIGIAFTSCTMLPCTKDGIPLCYVSSEYARNYNSWPKLWKDHRAQKEASFLTRLAVEYQEKWLDNYGGTVGLEWLLPKILETKNNENQHSTSSYGKTDVSSSFATTSTLMNDIDVWIEGGDFLVWHLISSSRTMIPSSSSSSLSAFTLSSWKPWRKNVTPSPCTSTTDSTSLSYNGCARIDDIVRSTCQAGYKGCWTNPVGSTIIPSPNTSLPSNDITNDSGYPSKAYLEAANLISELPKFSTGKKLPPGTVAGVLHAYAADSLRLPLHLPVSTGIIDAHAGVLGVGVTGPGTLVLVLGTSGCYMLMNKIKITIPGIAGIVENGILPSYVGYETGQSSVGDALQWVARLTQLSHEELIKQATCIEPGSNGVLATDWFLGARTPLMNGNLSGTFLGLTTTTSPGQLYRATMEAIGYGIKWITELFIDSGIPIASYIASGGLPHHNPLFISIIANILNAPIRITTETQPVALGAALLGVECANQYTHTYNKPSVVQPLTRSTFPLPDFTSVNQRCVALSSTAGTTVEPDSRTVESYRTLYPLYRKLVQNHEFLNVMEELRRYSSNSGGSKSGTVQNVNYHGTVHEETYR